jgi:chromosome segregation ATPase
VDGDNELAEIKRLQKEVEKNDHEDSLLRNEIHRLNKHIARLDITLESKQINAENLATENENLRAEVLKLRAAMKKALSFQIGYDGLYHEAQVVQAMKIELMRNLSR